MPCFILYSQDQTCLLLQVSLDLLCVPVVYDEKNIFFLVLVLEGLGGFHQTIQLQLLGIGGWGIDLDYCDVEWFALEMNPDRSVIFEVCHFQVLNFRLLLIMRATPFLLRHSCPQ